MRWDILGPLLLAVALASAPGAAAAGPAAGTASTADKVTLTVTVTDGLNQKLGDVTVVASWDGGSTERKTAANGKVFIDVPEGKRVELTVDDDRYTRNNPVVIRDASEQEVELTVYLKAEATVTVRDSEGAPVTGANVTLYKRGEVAARGRTGQDGTFTSGTIERGDYRVVVEKSGFLRNETTADIRGEDGVTVRIEEASVVLRFTVVDDHFSPAKPIQNARIDVGDRAILKTGPEGEQTTAVPVNSAVEITVTKDGYETVTRTVEVGEQPMDLTFTINREEALTLEVENDKVVVGSKLRVTVSDEYGDRVAGATVTVDGEAVGTTDAEGVLLVPLNESGTYDVAATANGTSADPVTVEVIEPGDDETPTEEPTATATEADATATEDRADTGAPVPGFGPLAAVAALGVVALLWRRRV